jgi:hypothetical protein
MVKAEISGLEITAERDGQEVESQTEPITVTVASTTFLLHDKVQTYQERMRADFFEDLDYGFSKRMTARLYPLMYAKAYYERMGPPRQSDAWNYMVMKKEIEVLSNDANFAVQRAVFGTQDPGADRVMAPAWACVAARNAVKMYDARSSSSDTSDNSPSNSNGYSEDTSASNRDASASSESASYQGFNFNGFNAKTFCSATRMLFGGVSGEPPTSIQEVVNQYLGQQAQANFERLNTGDQEVKIDKFAEPAYQDINDAEEITHDTAYESDTGSSQPEQSEESDFDQEAPDDLTDGVSYREIVERIYSYEVETSRGTASKDGAYPDASDDLPSDAENVDDQGISVVDNVETTVDHEETYNDEDGRTRQLHHFDIEVENRLENEITYETCETVENEYGEEVEDCTSGSVSETNVVTFNIEITVEGTFATDEDIQVDKLDMENPYSGDSPNFEEAIDLSLEEGVNIDSDNPETSLASSIGAGSVTEPGDLESNVDSQITPTKNFGDHRFFGDDDGSDESAPGEEETFTGEKGDLMAAMGQEVTQLHANVIDEDVAGTSPTGSPPPQESINPSPIDMATEDEVFEPLKLGQDEYVYYDTSGGYDGPQEMAKVAARLGYVDATNTWIDEVEEAREDSVSSANSQMSDSVSGSDNVLNQGLGRASETIGSFSTADPGTIDADTPLLEDIEYTVDGSPTYLAVSPVDRRQVPAVRPTHDRIEDAGNTMHAPLAVRKHNTFGHPGMPIIPWPSYWYLSVDFWDIKVKGEYARFEVQATNTAPDSPRTTTYIRQAQPVNLEIAGQQRTVGEVEPINFSSQTGVVIPVPGGTVYPKPMYGVGDDWLGSSPTSKPYQNLCSATWDVVGPGFKPYMAKAEGCDNVPEGNAGQGLQMFVPGSDEVLGSTGATDLVEYDSDDGRFELNDDVEIENDCDEDDFTGRLDGSEDDGPDESPRGWYEGLSDSEQTKVWFAQYCRLSGDYQDHYVNFVNGEEGGSEDDDQIASTWRDVITEDQIGYYNVRLALKYVTDTYDSPVAKDESLLEKHDVTKFQTADERNGDEDGYDSHKEPGIVTTVELEETDHFARVYSAEEGDNIAGGWIADPATVEGWPQDGLIDLFALWDYSIAGGDGWGDYRCIGKVLITDEEIDEPIRITVSKAGGFDANDPDYPINESLSGGGRQIQLIEGTIPDENWIPVGKVSELDGETFRDRYPEVAVDDDPTDHTGPNECTENIY